MPEPRSVLTRPVDEPDLVLRWADAASHSADGLVDVYLPPTPGRPAPVVVALHGGFWREEFDRRHLRPLAVALRTTGRVVVLPEYRRVGGRGGWPATADDIWDLASRLPGLLTQAIPERIATGAPTLLGHSAGGQLATWWALEAAGSPAAPAGVVALAPVADLVRAYRDGLGDGAVHDLLGGGPGRHPDAYASADVAARLRNGARTDGPLVVLHGLDDRQVPATHSRALADDVPAIDLRLLPRTEHFALIDPLSAAWPEVLAALGGWLRSPDG